MRYQSKEITDQELVKQALFSPNRYALIVERYQQSLLRYIARLGCRNNDDAHDILQEAFLKAYVNLNQYTPKLKFSSWIYRIAHNETMNFFRKSSARPKVALGSKDIFLFLKNVRDNADIVAQTDKKLVSKQMEKLLSDLEEKYRQPLMLKFLEDKSYEEISDIMRVPMGTVATLIKRGKQKLKVMLGGKNILNTF